MAKRTDEDEEPQHVLPGVPGPPKRKIIKRIETKCLERDDLASQVVALNDKITEMSEAIQKDLDEEKIEIYTYKNAAGLLIDVYNVRKLARRKSAQNPTKPKKGADE